MRILVVDDAQIMRQLVTEIIRSAMPNIAVLEVENGSPALGLIRKERFDLVIKDHSSCKLNGSGLIEDVSEECPDNVGRWIIMSNDPDELAGLRAVKEGGVPLIDKSELFEGLVPLILGKK